MFDHNHIKLFSIKGGRLQPIANLDVAITPPLGSDLKEGHQMFTLAFVWQLMRAYTLSLLAKVLITYDQCLD